MYQVKIGEKILYYPGNDEFAIYDTELTEDVGQAGEFTFKVPPTNPLYNSITSGSLITIEKEHKEFWRGEIRDVSIDFAKVASVYCIEDLAWLADEFLTPSKIINQSYKQRLDSMISSYNANRGEERQFISGYVYNGASLCNWQTEYEWSILDSIRKCICRDDLYIKVRRVYEGGILKRYIDVVRLQDYGKSSSQNVEYGYNLLDYVKDSDYGNLTNVLTPYGDELEDSEVYEDYSSRLQGTTISNNDSINTYGRHAKAVIFDGVTDVNTLNNLASSYLTRYSQPQLTMEIKAVDLSTIENVDDMAIGDTIHVVAKPFAVNQTLYLTEIKRDIQNIDKNTITLSGYVSSKTLTSQINNASDSIEELPSEDSLLKAAKRNALSMLLDETQGGYVVFEYDANNENIEAINICDYKTIDGATKRWRWSQNGLGYMERNTINDPWPNKATLKAAITKDGHICADFMTTGTLTAAIIKAGILSDKNGQFSLNMNTGALTMNSGTFKGDVNAGTVTGSAITGGTISGTKITSTSGQKTLVIDGAEMNLYGTGNSSAGYVRLYDGTLGAGKNFYPHEFGISSEECHAAWNNGDSYENVPSRYIVQVAKYFQEHGGWTPV